MHFTRYQGKQDDLMNPMSFNLHLLKDKLGFVPRSLLFLQIIIPLLIMGCSSYGNGEELNLGGGLEMLQCIEFLIYINIF